MYSGYTAPSPFNEFPQVEHSSFVQPADDSCRQTDSNDSGHDKDYIKLFNVKITNDNLTNIVDYDTIYRESLKDWKDTIKDYSFIFSADCFSTGNSEFVGTGHRKEYVQKCIDLYGNVICKFKEDSIDTEEYLNCATKISGIENDRFQGEYFDWKYAEVTIENFR